MTEQTSTTPGLDAMHVVSQHRGQEWRDVTPIRAWAEELVSHGGMNAAVGRSVLAKLDEGQPAGAVPDTGQPAAASTARCAADEGEACICRSDEPCMLSTCPDSACHAVERAAIAAAEAGVAASASPSGDTPNT